MRNGNEGSAGFILYVTSLMEMYAFNLQHPLTLVVSIGYGCALVMLLLLQLVVVLIVPTVRFRGTPSFSKLTCISVYVCTYVRAQ